MNFARKLKKQSRSGTISESNELKPVTFDQVVNKISRAAIVGEDIDSCTRDLYNLLVNVAHNTETWQVCIAKQDLLKIAEMRALYQERAYSDTIWLALGGLADAMKGARDYYSEGFLMRWEGYVKAKQTIITATAIRNAVQVFVRPDDPDNGEELLSVMETYAPELHEYMQKAREKKKRGKDDSTYAMVDRYNTLRSQGQSAENAKEQTAQEFNTTPKTIETYITRVNKGKHPDS